MSILFLLCTGALFVTALFAFRLRCEGFGCMGVGIVWMVWAVSYVLVTATGAVLRATLPHATATRSAVSIGLFALVILGAALVIFWLVSRTA